MPDYPGPKPQAKVPEKVRCTAIFVGKDAKEKCGECVDKGSGCLYIRLYSTMKSMNTKTGKLQHLLLEKIVRGEYRPGEKLPSVRELAEIHSVSTMTAKLAIGKLRSMGMVSTRQGAGSFVTHDPAAVKPPARHLRIGLAYLDSYHTYMQAPEQTHPLFMQWMRGLHDYFARDRATTVPLRYEKHEMCSPSSEIRLAVENSRIDGLIVTGWMEAEEADYLDEMQVPFVLLNHFLPEREVVEVSSDTVAALRLIVRHLVDLGHGDIVLIAYSTGRQIRHWGVGHYVRAAQLADCENFTAENVVVIDNESPRLPLEYEEYIEAALEKHPTAVVAADEVVAARLMIHAGGNGMKVPEDLSVAVFADSMPHLSPMNLTKTNIVELQRELARIAAELVERRLFGECFGSRDVVLMPALSVGDSTAPPRGVGGTGVAAAQLKTQEGGVR